MDVVQQPGHTLLYEYNTHCNMNQQFWVDGFIRVWVDKSERKRTICEIMEGTLNCVRITNNILWGLTDKEGGWCWWSCIEIDLRYL